MMNERSRNKWFKPLLSVLLAGSLAVFSGCGEEEKSETSTTKPSRDLAASAGAAEYHTGTGYGNTLFDSADKKCQGCHFELYDTWKSSMHSKSWTDTIFQTKYKEYLRLQLSKIGTSSTTTYGISTITGVASTDGNVTSSSTTRVAGGSAKVCVKCHAPGAFYAGDFNITVKKVADSTAYSSKTGADLQSYLNGLESGGTTTTNVITVAAVAKDTNVYTASYHVGHEANREGINCAACHSIESIRMMGPDGNVSRDNGTYVLKGAIKYGPIGATRFAAGTTLSYDDNASNPHMNSFFSLVGPDVYGNVTATPHDAAGMNDMTKKSADGRFTYRSIDLNGTNGKTHYTGGPFYGPYGITGTSNSNLASDDTNRSALGLDKGDESVYKARENHFSNNAKALCLSCHQRSAGAMDPNSNITSIDGNASSENQMELCSTWNAMSDEVDNNYADTRSSPKCTKCHMPRLDNKTVLHKWNNPNELFSRSELLTDYFDPKDGGNLGEGHNPVYGKWMNDHGFIGANRQTEANYLNKIKSGFDADVNASVSNGVLTVSTSLLNKTAHMLPGAHPMRRMMTRVVVTDANGSLIEYNTTATTGLSAFEDIINTVVPSNSNDVINTTGTGKGSVQVIYNSSRKIQISGMAADLNGSTVAGQKFANTSVSITAADVISKIQNINAGDSNATITNAAITADSNASTFTRIYGRETGKSYSGTFVVRPGFDSNTVPANSDNRLQPNEKETYTVKYDVGSKTGLKVTYKVYYMLTGANGSMGTVGSDGFPADGTATTEVFSKTLNVN